MEEDIILAYHPLILGALKKCHIYPHHPSFEDYLQAARIELLLLHREYESNRHLKQPPFPPYAYQKIYWRTLDLIRKEMRRLDSDILDDTFLETCPDTHTVESSSTYVEVTDTYDRLCHLLSPLEKNVLHDRLFEQLNVTQIARKYNVSRQSVYRWQESIQKKYKKIEKKM